MNNIQPLVSSLRPTVVAAASLRHFWAHRFVFLKAALLPAVILAITTSFLPMPFIRIERPVPHALWALGLGGVIFGFGFSVSWRRYILLGEKPLPIYLARPFWSYLGGWIVLYLLFLLIYMILYIPAVICAMPILMKAMPDNPSPASPAHLDFSVLEPWQIATLVVLFVVPLLPPLWMILRRMLVLTARSVGNRNFKCKHSSQVMRGHVWQLVGAWSLAVLCPMVPSMALYALIFLAIFGPLPYAVNLALILVYELLVFAWVAIAGYVMAAFYSRLAMAVSADPI